MKREAADLPTVSILTPVLNSARTIGEALASVRAQDYPQERIQLIVADAGSTDGTLDIVQSFAPVEIVSNPLRTGEAGKSAALAKATGELVLLLDSDNVLPDSGWLRRMVAPFLDPEVFASEPIRYERRATDPALTRYFALLGMNDPLCLFAGNYDRECAVTGRWTGLRVPSEKRDGWIALDLAPDRPLPTLGANGTVLRRSVLADAVTEPYYFDIDVVQQLVAAGHRRFAKVDVGIVHLYAARLRDFSRKQDRRVRDFLHFRKARPGGSSRTYRWRGSGAVRGAVLFSIATATLLPLLVQTLLGAFRRPDSAWLYHVPVCWVTLLRYGAAALCLPFRRPAPASRDAWQKN